MPDQPLLLQFGERLELRRDAARLGSVEAAHPEVHHVESFEPEVPEVVVHLLDEFVRLAGVRPATVGVAAGTDLRHEVQVLGVGVQGLADHLVRHVRTVEVGRVDVGDAELDDRAEHPDGFVAVGGRTEDAGSGELHGAVPDSVSSRSSARRYVPPGRVVFVMDTTMRACCSGRQSPRVPGTTGTRIARAARS